MRYDGVGDTAALTPLVVALHRAGHELGMVASRAAVDLFRPDVVRSHVVEDVLQPHSVLDDVRARSYEIALIATEKPYAYTLAQSAHIPQRIGFWNGFAKPLKSLWVRGLCTGVRLRGANFGNRHEVEWLFALGRGLHDEKAPTRDLGSLRHVYFRIVPEKQDMFTMQVTPKWLDYGSIEALAAMVRELSERTWLRLVGATSEEPFLVALEQHIPLTVERHGTAATWVERIAASRVLLTPDTGAAHVAGMIGTKVIDCFPAHTSQAFQQRWRPWASPAALYTMPTLQRRGAISVIAEACAAIDEPLSLQQV